MFELTLEFVESTQAPNYKYSNLNPLIRDAEGSVVFFNLMRAIPVDFSLVIMVYCDC